MVQVEDSLSGDWSISYADSAGIAADVEGLRVLCFALYLTSNKSPCAFRTSKSKRKLEAFQRAIRTLGVTEQDEAKAECLTFRHIVFFVDDLWIFPKLVTFWQNGEDLSRPITEGCLGKAGKDLEAIFWRWFRRWEGETNAPFRPPQGPPGRVPGGLRRRVKRSEQFQEFTKWVADLCRPRMRGRKAGKPRNDGLQEAVVFIQDVMARNPNISEREVIRGVLGLDGSQPIFHVVPRLPQRKLSLAEGRELVRLLEQSIWNPEALSSHEKKRLNELSWLSEVSDHRKCIVSNEVGEDGKGQTVANDKAVRLLERHLKKHRSLTGS